MPWLNKDGLADVIARSKSYAKSLFKIGSVGSPGILAPDGTSITVDENGTISSPNNTYRELTKAEYDALTEEEKNNGTIYFITDAYDANAITVDNALSTESTNAVQNKIITECINDMNDSLDIVKAHVKETGNVHGLTLSDLGIAKVENKSSEDIRGEITKENVVDALGYDLDSIVSGSNYASKEKYGDYFLSVGRNYSTNIGEFSLAFGESVDASSSYSCSIGLQTKATGECSNATGKSTYASGANSHAEGFGTYASGANSHAEGYEADASGANSHAEGFGTYAIGKYSHSSGYNTIANTDYSFAIGMFNNPDISPYDYGNLFMVGYGTSDSRSNVFRVADNATYGKTYKTEGADYAEYFEWDDKNIDCEDRRGRFVTLDGENIRLANSNDNYIVGIISANPSIIGNSASEEWNGKYETDIFGKIKREDITIKHSDNTESICNVRKLSKDFNPDINYISRENRKEWDAVGMIGKLIAIDDGTSEVNGYCYPSSDGIATKSSDKTRYRVLSRIDESHIKVLII